MDTKEKYSLTKQIKLRSFSLVHFLECVLEDFYFDPAPEAGQITGRNLPNQISSVPAGTSAGSTTLIAVSLNLVLTRFLPQPGLSRIEKKREWYGPTTIEPS